MPGGPNPATALSLADSLLRRKVRDRMPEQLQKMSLHVFEDYPDDVSG